GVVCALRPEKRLDLLLDAFSKIAAPGRKLAVVGSGPELPALQRQSRALNLDSYCHFEPATSSVAEWLRSMDIFLLPSPTEARSNSLMEAMACGVAVVASDVGGNPELVTHGETGLLFPSGDEDALASALSRLAESALLRTDLGKRASVLIHEKFSLAASVNR